ncbi:MAG: carboxypeptidase regulatory-like domain-containing protein [Bryobacterales bacterium]|nr:carboxypeptidase regulatory-like domain-containing protein [Bryobacterales bacterium]
MRLRLLAAFSLLLLALPGVVLADPPMTTIRIEVKTYSDKPIDRASVIVKFVEGRDYAKLGKKIQTSWQLKTNQEGLAKIPAVPQGKIQVQVIAKGYQTFGQVFEVNEAERTIEVKLNAPQPQVSAHQ